jgi:hypothetical protein
MEKMGRKRKKKDQKFAIGSENAKRGWTRKMLKIKESAASQLLELPFVFILFFSYFGNK